MVRVGRVVCVILKLVPLGIYLRSAACKFDLPIMGCDGPLCPVAIGQPAVDGCMPTANSAELKAWCEHGWVPWLTGLLKVYKVPPSASASVTCSASDGFMLMRVIGATELFGYVLLWIMPQFAATLLSFVMGFAIHFHLRHLNEPAHVLGLQWTLFAASLAVLYLEIDKEDYAEAPKAKTA